MRKICIFLIIILGCSLIVLNARAETESQLNGPAPTPQSQPTDYISYLYTLGLLLVGIAALGALVYAGLLYMLSDTVVKTEDAKKWIWSSLSGLTLGLASWLVLNMINPDLVHPALSLPQIEIKAGTSGTSSGATTLPGGLSIDEAAARTILQENSISTKNSCPPGISVGCVNLAGIQRTTIDGLITLKDNCAACSVFVTSGTEGGHSQDHAEGRKVDLRLNSGDELDQFLKSGTPQGTVDGYPAYGFQYASYNIKAVRESDHWDIKVIGI